MSNTLALTIRAAFVAGILGLSAGAFAQSPPATPGPDAPSIGSDMHHGMMGDMNGRGSMDMTQMHRMMENCDRMMEGMHQPSGGAPNPKPDNG
jgi:periplasmic protein CpxP/Spy